MRAKNQWAALPWKTPNGLRVGSIVGDLTGMVSQRIDKFDTRPFSCVMEGQRQQYLGLFLPSDGRKGREQTHTDSAIPNFHSELSHSKKKKTLVKKSLVQTEIPQTIVKNRNPLFLQRILANDVGDSLVIEGLIPHLHPHDLGA